jgi:hypothetical protein
MNTITPVWFLELGAGFAAGLFWLASNFSAKSRHAFAI